MVLDVIIFLSLGLVIVVLLAINAFFIIYFRKTTNNIDKLLEKGKIKDFKDIFLAQKERSEDLEEKIKDAFSKIKNLEDICEITIQKVGVVRFNPFNDLGGNQSFAVALLDGKNNGFIISSLFVSDGNRVYTKAVKLGKSEHSLSNEEVEAINRAMGSKK